MRRTDWDAKYQLVPGCGHGHEVALAVAHGLDATGLNIAPTGLAEARAKYPHLAERFVTGNLFDPPEEMRGAYDVVLEHTCMSVLCLRRYVRITGVASISRCGAEVS